MTTNPIRFPLETRLMGETGDSAPDCLYSSALLKGKGAKIFRKFQI
jgi:hypothetical protein